MNQENIAILKNLLASIRKLGYTTYRQKRKHYIELDIHIYTIVNKVTKDDFILNWHPDFITWFYSPIMYGFFSLQHLNTRKAWPASEVKELLENAFQQLVLANEIDPRNEQKLKAYHAYQRKLNEMNYQRL